MAMTTKPMKNHPKRKAPRSSDEAQPILGINPKWLALGLKGPQEMRKIIEAQDILVNAQHCVECIFLAATGLAGGKNEIDPIQAVADIASKKIDEAIALLDEYRKAPDAGPGADREAA
jgi:hypothetical protein